MVEVPKSVIDTLIAEAVGEGDEGMRRVAETIINRSAIRGLSPEQVVQQPYQYTGYSSPGPATVRAQQDPNVRSAAEAAWMLAQQPGDPTGGADHYFNPNIVQPRWANSMTPTGQYGNHAYYSSRPIPPGEIPNTVATALATTRPAPAPVTMSPDLSQMRNPLMSSSARAAQVTPYPASQSLDMLVRRSLGTTVATIPTTPQNNYAQAARLAALRANQSIVERNPPARPVGSSARNIADQRNEQMIMRTPLREARLAPSAPGLPLNTQGVTIRPPQIQIVTPPQANRSAPVPLMASSGLQARRAGGIGMNAALGAMPPVAPIPVARPPQLSPQAMAYSSGGGEPLRVVVNGANSYGGGAGSSTPVQALQNQGYSAAQAYALANAQAQQRAEDRAGIDRSGQSDWFRNVTGG